MLGNGEAKKEAIRPDFNKSIFIDFVGAKITSDAGFLLMREVDQRFLLHNGYDSGRLCGTNRWSNGWFASRARRWTKLTRNSRRVAA
jgi:hypothetical protein